MVTTSTSMATKSTLTLLQCLILCKLNSPAGSSGAGLIRSDHVFMKCLFEVKALPISLRDLTVRWEHDGRELVEFQGKKLTVFDPRVRLSEEELEKGNASLILTDVSFSDSGKYAGVIQYGVSRETCNYKLNVQALWNQINPLLLPAPLDNSKENLRGKDISRSEGDMELMRSVSDRPEDKHRPLKIGLVMGAIGASFTMAFLLFICYKP